MTALFVVFCCAVLSCATLALLWQNRQLQYVQLQTQAANLAKAVARQAESSFDQTDGVLISTLTSLRELHALSSEPLSTLALSRLLQAHQRTFRGLDELLLMQDDGHILASSRTRPASDEATPELHPLDAEGELLIGLPSRDAQGSRSLSLGRRLSDQLLPGGGWIIARLRLSHFTNFYASFSLSADSSVALLLQDGRLLLRMPRAEREIGDELSDTVFVSRAKQEQQGTASHRSEFDGVQRLFAYQRLPRYPMLVTVALGEHAAMESWSLLARYTLSLLLLALAVFALLGCHLLQQVRLRAIGEQDLQDAKQALEKANAELASQALHDGLTGLSNRWQLDQTLHREVALAHRNDSPLALLMLDIDHFKAYNDHFGHPAGDRCLRKVARCLDELRRRPDDLAARYGGEEFVLVLPGCDERAALDIAERARECVAELSIQHPQGLGGYLTVSIGVALSLGEIAPQQLVENADRALYRAKHCGRNRVQLFEG